MNPRTHGQGSAVRRCHAPSDALGRYLRGVLFNLVLTLEGFLLSKNLLMLGLGVPIHGLCALLCARDARIFDLSLLWLRIHLPTRLATAGSWGAAAYGPLSLAMPDLQGRRTGAPVAEGGLIMGGARASLPGAMSRWRDTSPIRHW